MHAVRNIGPITSAHGLGRTLRTKFRQVYMPGDWSHDVADSKDVTTSSGDASQHYPCCLPGIEEFKPLVSVPAVSLACRPEILALAYAEPYCRTAIEALTEKLELKNQASK